LHACKVRHTQIVGSKDSISLSECLCVLVLVPCFGLELSLVTRTLLWYSEMTSISLELALHYCTQRATANTQQQNFLSTTSSSISSSSASSTFVCMQHTQRPEHLSSHKLHVIRMNASLTIPVSTCSTQTPKIWPRTTIRETWISAD
jgi:hypothetical protein